MKTLIKFLIINAFILMVYIFSGCEQITDPVDNSATDNNTLNKAYQTRPFVAEVVATFLTQVNDSVTVYFGTGHATHWGRFTVMDTVTHHINQTSYTVDGNDWITVANGDLVHMTWFADYYDPCSTGEYIFARAAQ